MGAGVIIICERRKLHEDVAGTARHDTRQLEHMLRIHIHVRGRTRPHDNDDEL